MTVGGTERTLTYDTNGNVTEERVIGGSTRTYQWDSLNRLIAIQSDKVPVVGSWRTEFAYDGQSRRVGIVEKILEDSGWTTESSARYLWEGTEIIQKRDASGSTVTAKYFDQGEIRVFGSSTIPYYFTRDHLGSVREVVNQGGVIAQSFDYTAWGERTSSTAGALEWGFTGHHYHEKSGLSLAMFRAYDANLGRWLSEDPLGEAGGLNLYGYVGNEPVVAVDPLGLALSEAAKELAHRVFGDGAETKKGPIPKEKVAELSRACPEHRRELENVANEGIKKAREKLAQGARNPDALKQQLVAQSRRLQALREANNLAALRNVWKISRTMSAVGMALTCPSISPQPSARDTDQDGMNNDIDPFPFEFND